MTLSTPDCGGTHSNKHAQNNAIRSGRATHEGRRDSYRFSARPAQVVPHWNPDPFVCSTRCRSLRNTKIAIYVYISER